VFIASGLDSKFRIPERFMTLLATLPRTSTGKLDKKPLREKHSGVLTT